MTLKTRVFRIGKSARQVCLAALLFHLGLHSFADARLHHKSSRFKEFPIFADSKRRETKEAEEDSLEIELVDTPESSPLDERLERVQALNEQIPDEEIPDNPIPDEEIPDNPIPDEEIPDKEMRDPSPLRRVEAQIRSLLPGASSSSASPKRGIHAPWDGVPLEDGLVGPKKGSQEREELFWASKAYLEEQLRLTAQQPPPAPEEVEEPAEEALQEEPALEEIEEQQPQEEETQEPPQTYLLKFNNVRLPAILTIVSQMTGKNFIFDEAEIDFAVTIVSNEPTTVDNIITAILQELRIRGLSLMEVGNNLIIHTNRSANSPGEIITEGESPSESAQLITQVFKLENLDPSSLISVIEPMLSANALIEAVPNSRHLILTDLTANVEKIRTLIKKIDTPSSQFEIGRYTVRNAPANRVLEMAQKLFEPITLGQPFVLVAHPETNSIYIVSSEGLVNRAIRLMQSIDQDEAKTQILSLDRLSLQELLEQGGGEEIVRPNRRREQLFKEASHPLGSVEATKFAIYKLQYRKGQEIQDALESIAESLELTLLDNTDLITTINTVQYIEATNSIVFTGTNASIAKVRGLIKQIDIPVRQVLIEVLLIETNIQDSLTYGTDWGARLTDTCVGASEAFVRADSPLVGSLDITSPSFSTVNPSALARTSGFNWGIVGRHVSRNGISFDSIGALVSALHNDRQIDLILNPKLLVEDNATAEIFVGINTAFQTQSIANDEGNIITSSVEFRDVGSTLKVTPIIGDNGIVTLEIKQENSSAAQNPLTQNGTTTTTTTTGQTVVTSQTSGVTDFGPTTRKTTTTTRIHVPDKYFVILSGQIRDEVTVDRQQVPCLGGLPFLGALFSRQATLVEKRNQMLFLRPVIIENHDINRETKRQQDLFLEHSRNPKRWEYEVDKALEWLNVDEPYCDPELEHPLIY